MAVALEPTEAGGLERPALPSLAEVQAAFPQFEVLELIGQGGMGCVFKARQPKLDRFVALKLLPASLAERDPAFADRFEREGKLLARLHHPNVVTVHDSGLAGGFFYLLMEYVDGVNLRQAMRTRKFTPQQALGIVPRICDALQYAHEEGVLHRDIKPENILLDAKGRVKLADFGIAKLIGGTDPAASATLPEQPGFTRSDVALGTPSYMAPEQRDTPADVDHRADIYSLGVVFYELLTGELPAGTFTPPSARSEADPRVDVIVKQALESERERRQHSAGEMRTQIETVASLPLTRERSDSRALASPPPRWLSLVAAVAVLCSLAATWITRATDATAGGAPVTKTHIGIGLPMFTDAEWPGQPLASGFVLGPALRTSHIAIVLAMVFWAVWLRLKARAGERLDSMVISKGPGFAFRAGAFWAGSCAFTLWAVFLTLGLVYAVGSFAGVREWPLPMLPVWVAAVIAGSVWAWSRILSADQVPPEAHDLASPANPAIRRMVMALCWITSIMIVVPMILDGLNRPEPVAADAVRVGRTATRGSADSGVWSRTWKVRAGQQHIWQSVGIPGLPTARMVPDQREGPFVIHVSLQLRQLGAGKVRVTHDVGGFKASVDVEARLADLIREADAAPMGSGFHALPLCTLDCAPLLLAKMPADTPLTNLGGIGGSSDDKPQPASAWYLHVWQTAPGNGRSAKTTRVFPNLSHEHLPSALAQSDVLGMLAVRREPDGRLRYRTDYYGFSGFVNAKSAGEIEMDRVFIIGNPRDSRKGCAVLTHEPKPDTFSPVETWTFYPQKGTPAALLEWLRSSTFDVLPKVQWQQVGSGVELTGEPEHVRPLLTALHCGDHAEVSDVLQLPFLNMPPDFFAKLAVSSLLTAHPFTNSVLAPGVIQTLNAAGITPAQLTAALRRHVLDLSKMEIRNNEPPFESITRTPGASTTYDIAIPLGDEDENIHVSARKLTLRIERTTQQVGTLSRIVLLAPWLIEEAKQQPGTPTDVQVRVPQKTSETSSASTTLEQDAGKLADGKVWQSEPALLKSRDGVPIPNQRLVMEFAAATSDKHDARVKLALMSSITAAEALPLSVSGSIGDTDYRDVHLREKDGIRTMKMVRSIETVDHPKPRTAEILDTHFSTLVRYELRDDRLILLDLPVDRPLDWGASSFVMPQASVTLRPQP